ncbi:hypothetical protein, partial [Baileyella intestinalis]|uniref:hypothetical protein n=1 Tax=Baileyella intestinalis TaxID=2606709 RepID=UPI00198088B0
WSEKTVLKLFNDPKFPATDFGRNKVIEADALRNYFSTRHEKSCDDTLTSSHGHVRQKHEY